MTDASSPGTDVSWIAWGKLLDGSIFLMIRRPSSRCPAPSPSFGHVTYPTPHLALALLGPFAARAGDCAITVTTA